MSRVCYLTLQFLDAMVFPCFFRAGFIFRAQVVLFLLRNEDSTIHMGIVVFFSLLFTVSIRLLIFGLI